MAVPLIPIIYGLCTVLSTVSTVANTVRVIKEGGPMPENTTLKPEDVVANALMMGLNALFGAWESAYKATNGKIASWEELADRNKLLQAKIDAEKAQG